MKPDRAQVLTQGLVAGLVGYAAVVLFFIVANLVAGRSPFHTAAALGSALFHGLSDPARLVIEPGPVLAMNGLHLVLSLAVGTVVAWLLSETERHHSFGISFSSSSWRALSAACWRSESSAPRSRI
jgi:hypothetical protein